VIDKMYVDAHGKRGGNGTYNYQHNEEDPKHRTSSFPSP
jgi:hypothetical protein